MDAMPAPDLDADAEAVAERAERELRPRLPAGALRAVLPANADPLVPADAARRARFTEHLIEMAEAAVLGPVSADPAGVEPPTNAREALSTAACAACRGSCCRAGADHAYLTEETLARTMEAHPGWTLARILEAYLEHLPAETTRDSCIYHGPAGCGLPRALRSPTCNLYRCAKLQQLRSQLPEQEAPPVLAVLFDRGRWARTALLDAAGVRLLAEAPPGALPAVGP